jgi:hypothetical protein
MMLSEGSQNYSSEELNRSARLLWRLLKPDYLKRIVQALFSFPEQTY